jgi:hypothetical protein
MVAALAFFGLAQFGVAQQFIPQTYTYGANETHQDAMRYLGAPASHGGNQGLPMRDTITGTRTATGADPNWRGNTIWQRGDGASSSFRQPWRGDTIFNPSARASNYNYQYNPQYYQYQQNIAQIQQAVQQIAGAVQQARMNRQQMQYYSYPTYGYSTYSYPSYGYQYPQYYR